MKRSTILLGMWMAVASTGLGDVNALTPNQMTSPKDKTPSSPAIPPALYFIENVGPIVYTRNLARITIGPDGKLSREKLLTRNEYFFAYCETPQIIIDHRYFVTTKCGVIDLASRQVITQEDTGEYLGEEKGKIYYCITRNAIRENGYFSFDLTTHQVAKISPPWHSDLPGVISPNRTMSVTSEDHVTTRLHKIDGTTKDIAKGYKAFMGGESQITNDIWPLPFLWLDNTRILTQKSNGKLVVLNIDGTAEDLVDVHDAAIGNGSRPRLWFDPLGRIIYTACDEVEYQKGVYHQVEYLIELKEKRASLLKTYALGNGFEVSTTLDKDGAFPVFHDGREIGKRNFRHDQAVTAPGLIAISEVDPHGNPYFPTDVAVWNASRNDWQTTPKTDPQTVQCLVGWAP
jgi:hypothetical protein